MSSVALLSLTLLPLAASVGHTPAPASPAAVSPVVTAPAANPSSLVKLEFPRAGFRINAFEPPSKEGFTFVMALPIAGKSSGFKVTVIRFPQTNEKPPRQVEFYPRSGYSILYKRTPSPTEVQAEYTKQYDQHSQKEHDYTRTLYAHGTLYDVTAETADTDWHAVAAKLKACVDSFEPSPDPAPGKVAFPDQGFRLNLIDEVVPVDVKQKLLSMVYFGSLIYVSIEPYTKTLKDYQAERKPSMMRDSKHKFKIMNEYAPAENALVTEFAEELGVGKDQTPIQDLSIEKVILAHGQLYRAVGQFSYALDDEPKRLGQLKALVESLGVMSAPGPATTPASTATAVPALAPASAPVPAK